MSRYYVVRLRVSLGGFSNMYIEERRVWARNMHMATVIATRDSEHTSDITAAHTERENA